MATSTGKNDGGKTPAKNGPSIRDRASTLLDATTAFSGEQKGVLRDLLGLNAPEPPAQGGPGEEDNPNNPANSGGTGGA